MNNNNRKHKILELLAKQYHAGQPSTDGRALGLKLKDIATGIKCDEEKTLNICCFLLDEEELQIVNFENFKGYLTPNKGLKAYEDRKYLRINKKTKYDLVFNSVKLISTILLLGIATTTFVMNILETKKNKSEIELMKKKIEKLETE